MKNSQVKNIIIIILVLLNIAFLIQLIPKEIEKSKFQKETMSALSKYLSDHDVALNEEILLDYGETYPVRWHRNEDAENKLVNTFLADAVLNDSNTGMFQYSGNEGSAYFRFNGNYLFDLSISDIDTSAFLNLLAQLEIPSSDIIYSTISDNETLALVPSYINSIPVFDQFTSFRFVDGKLVEIIGSQTSSFLRISNLDACMSAPTALIEFMNQKDSLGIVCSRIEKLEPGYKKSLESDGTVFYPCWRITTDAGIYEIDYFYCVSKTDP